MDDEGIQLRDYPLYRPNKLTKQVTIQEEPQATPEHKPQPYKTQLLLEQLIENYLEYIGNQLDQNQHRNLLYQLILQVAQSIFDRTITVQQFDAASIAKFHCIHFIQKLRKYFDTKKSHELLNIIAQSKEVEDNEDDGFEHDKYMAKISQTFVNTINTIDEANEINKQMGQKDTLVQELQSKLTFRETQFKQITTGYLMDVQHMKEQMFRSQKNGSEFYEVQYFDDNDGLDDQMMVILNKKLSIMKYKFEKKTQQLLQTIMDLSEKHQNCIKMNSTLQDKLKSLDQPIGLMARAFTIDNDPYKSWKHIQDLKGNEYFFKIFENQKHTYGIDFREIDKLLLQSKAQQRELSIYQKQINEKYEIFVEKQLLHTDDLRKELVQKDKVIENLKKVQDKLNYEVIDYMKGHIQQVVSIRKDEMLQNLFRDHGDLYEVKMEFDRYIAKSMLNRWALIGRLLKAIKNNKDYQRLSIEVKELIIDQVRINSIKSEQQELVRHYQELYEELLQKYEEEKLSSLFQQYQYSVAQKQMGPQNIRFNPQTCKWVKVETVNQYCNTDPIVNNKPMVRDVSVEAMMIDMNCVQDATIVNELQQRIANKPNEQDVVVVNKRRNTANLQQYQEQLVNPIIQQEHGESTEMLPEMPPIKLAIDKSDLMKLDQQESQLLSTYTNMGSRLNRQAYTSHNQNRSVKSQSMNDRFRLTNLRQGNISDKDNPSIQEQQLFESSQNILVADTIFQRLFKDSANKQGRLEVLRNHIETLDQFKWEQIITIISPHCNYQQRKNNLKLTTQRSQQVKDNVHSHSNQRSVDNNSELGRTQYLDRALDQYRNSNKHRKERGQKCSQSIQRRAQANKISFEFASTHHNFGKY